MTNKKHIFILPLEKVETRYTWQWYSELPKQIAAARTDPSNQSIMIAYVDNADSVWSNEFDIEIISISGQLPEQTATAGAFLNFASTNIWKSSQAVEWFKLIHQGRVPKGSRVLFTDAWNPVIIQTRYVSDLLKLDLELHGIWHAGAHDEWDFLGQNPRVREWGLDFELALWKAIDYNYFTTNFYLNKFAKTWNLDPKSPKFVRTGYPNRFLLDSLDPLPKQPVNKRQKQFLFPHRLAKEKQYNIFQALEKIFDDYKFVTSQAQKLTKAQYHQQLIESQFVFSAALQETHGIAQTEAVIAGSIPLVPDRLSYAEMYMPMFKYPSEWTQSFDAYCKYESALVNFIMELEYQLQKFPELVVAEIEKNREHLIKNYIDAPKLYENLLK
jgi:hypothetical protein